MARTDWEKLALVGVKALTQVASLTGTKITSPVLSSHVTLYHKFAVGEKHELHAMEMLENS